MSTKVSSISLVLSSGYNSVFIPKDSRILDIVQNSSGSVFVVYEYDSENQYNGYHSAIHCIPSESHLPGIASSNKFKYLGSMFMDGNYQPSALYQELELPDKSRI